jgi:acetyl esterase/lipase
MKWVKTLTAVLLLICVVSCNKKNSDGADIIAASTQLNVSYGTNTLQNMDVYLPANRSTSTTNVLILIHGGSWTTGDKTDLTSYIDSFKRRLPGYAIFNINYRLSAIPNNVFPTQENDVKAAVEFIYGKSAAYLISAKYGYIGFSAGAQLAMLQGFKYTAPVKAKLIASFSGPSDLIELYNHPTFGNPLISLGLANAIGSTPLQDSLLYANSSPVNFISGTSPPTIVFQGGTDPLVSTTQALEVQTKLVNSGVKNQYVFYPAAAHIGDWDKPTMFDAFNKLQDFITANIL